MDAQKIFEELIMEFVDAGIPLPVKKIYHKLEYNYAVTRLGSCKKDGDHYTITLSRNAMKDREQIRNTLAHELLHTLPGCMNHGVKFHRYGDLVFEKLGIPVMGRASQQEAQKSGIREAYVDHAKYKVVCRDCGNVIYRQKKSRLITHTASYRCGKCGGKLTVYVRKY